MSRVQKMCTAVVGVLLVTLYAPAALAQDNNPAVAIFDFDIGTSESVKVTKSGTGGRSSTEVEASAKTSLLTNKLITELTQSGVVSVVERDKMNKLMDETKLSQQDLTSAGSAQQIGKLLGADYMVFGSITRLEPGVTFEELSYGAGKRKIMSMNAAATARLVITESGQIEAAEDIEASRRDKVLNPANEDKTVPANFQRKTLNELSKKISNRLVSAINPIKVASQDDDTIYLTRSRMKEGQTLEVVKLGEKITAPDSGKVIGRKEERIAIIDVIAGLNNMSKAKVKKWLSSGSETKIIPKGSVARPIQ